MATLTPARSDSQHRPLSAAPAWTVRAFGVTDIGHVRDRNEDHFLIAELTKTLHAQQTSLQQPDVMEAHQHGHLFVVADGMGGHAGGEVASRLATETVEEFMLDALKWFMDLRAENENDEIIVKLQDALKEADAGVMRAAEKRPKLQGMGTTLTLAFFLRGELFIAHAGDSRASLFRHGHLARLTRDHTLAAEMVRRGELAPEKVATHRLRHVVTNIIGGPSQGVYAEVAHATIEPGDRLLLCSDGLTDMLPDAEIAEMMREHPEPEDACHALLTEALDRGGNDNVTVVVAGFEAE
jgi:serine/threonine protein phosphatase PrpC